MCSMFETVLAFLMSFWKVAKGPCVEDIVEGISIFSARIISERVCPVTLPYAFQETCSNGRHVMTTVICTGRRWRE